ncbi:MAG: TIGR00282 family metallophosphoesterase [Candidatus Omnitrophota bacterium]
MIKILFVGDIMGRPGRMILKSKLNQLMLQYNVGLCIANAENAAGGKGLNYKIAQELFSYGVDVLTMGNHTWDNKDIFNFIDDNRNIVRPYNYPPSVPGKGFVTVETRNGVPVVVGQLCGRLYMGNADCPFRTADAMLKEIGGRRPIVIDFHGEATSEKVAMGWYLDGRVSAVIGTHTHIPTADERILPQGAAFICDVGMTGPYDSVIGMEIESTTNQFITGIRRHHQVAKQNVKICAVMMQVDEASGKASSIERVTVCGADVTDNGEE